MVHGIAMVNSWFWCGIIMG